MKARRTYATLIATLLAVGSVGSTPSLARDSRYLKVAYSAVLNGKEIPAGEYRVSWKTHSPEATIAFARGGEVMLTVEGRWTDRQVRYERNTVVYNLNPDGSRTILEIRFAGLRSVLVFGGEGVKEQTKLLPPGKKTSDAAAVRPPRSGGLDPRVKVQFLGKPREVRRVPASNSFDDFWLRELLQSRPMNSSISRTRSIRQSRVPSESPWARSITSSLTNPIWGHKATTWGGCRGGSRRGRCFASPGVSPALAPPETARGRPRLAAAQADTVSFEAAATVRLRTSRRRRTGSPAAD